MLPQKVQKSTKKLADMFNLSQISPISAREIDAFWCKQSKTGQYSPLCPPLPPGKRPHLGPLFAPRASKIPFLRGFGPNCVTLRANLPRSWPGVTDRSNWGVLLQCNIIRCSGPVCQYLFASQHIGAGSHARADGAFWRGVGTRTW